MQKKYSLLPNASEMGDYVLKACRVYSGLCLRYIVQNNKTNENGEK